MANLLSVAPVLLVCDVVAAANYYREKLGFSYDRFWGEPANFCMVRRDNLTVMLSQVDPGTKLVPNWQVVDKMWDAYFWVDNVETLYAQYQKSGAQIDYTLHLKPYGVKEFGIQDLDGHDIAFGQVIEE
ncbi:VOC family protein [Bythopirellula polymerisocia]|nr:VOC family protein [Bythopirellula polymerisocia]